MYPFLSNSLGPASWGGYFLSHQLSHLRYQGMLHPGSYERRLLGKALDRLHYKTCRATATVASSVPQFSLFDLPDTQISTTIRSFQTVRLDGSYTSAV